VDIPEVVCNAFNEYFSTIGDTLLSSMVNGKTGNNVDILNYFSKSQSSRMFLEPVCDQELAGEKHKLNNSKSPGPDGLRPKLVKIVASVIVRPLTHI
jgi:hypothetical protein